MSEDDARLLKEVAELVKLEVAIPVFVQKLRLAYIKAHDLSVESSYDPKKLHYHKDMHIFIVTINSNSGPINKSIYPLNRD